MTVGILAAVYFFFVRPTLHTTEKIGHEVNGSISKSLQEANIGKTIEDVNRKVQREIKRSIRSSTHHGQADRLIGCIQRAHQDVDKIQRCTAKY
ncbi:MAG TPA: hypothetical protein VFS64_09645 [Solirubrobacterales bacterium]|nr:hypothetical protein [Solirubrobacterales bacterium]